MMIRTLIYWLLGAIIAFAAATYLVPADHVFHALNAVAMAAGITCIIAYSPAIKDAWDNRVNHVSPGHLLAFGVVTNWAGLLVRLGRWFFTSDSPSGGFEQWAYNTGLWASICAAAFLVGAIALTDPGWTRRDVYVHAGLFAAIVLALWIFDALWVGVPHFGPIPY